MSKEVVIRNPNIPPQIAKQVEDAINGALGAGEDITTKNVGAFSQWLKDKNPQLYEKVKPYLDLVFDALKSALKVTHNIFWHIGKALCN